MGRSYGQPPKAVAGLSNATPGQKLVNAKTNNAALSPR
jgi:hypothetical protein